jgi:hypothetical protein
METEFSKNILGNMWTWNTCHIYLVIKIF